MVCSWSFIFEKKKILYFVRIDQIGAKKKKKKEKFVQTEISEIRSDGWSEIANFEIVASPLWSIGESRLRIEY